MGLFDHFFKVDEEDVSAADDALEEAKFIVSFASHPQYPKLIEWLDAEADRRIPINIDGQTMVSAISRQNTLKEVRDKLRQDLQRASATISRAREDHNG